MLVVCVLFLKSTANKSACCTPPPPPAPGQPPPPQQKGAAIEPESMATNVRNWVKKWEAEGTLKQKPSKHDTLLDQDGVILELTGAYKLARDHGTHQHPVLIQSADFLPQTKIPCT